MTSLVLAEFLSRICNRLDDDPESGESVTTVLMMDQRRVFSLSLDQSSLFPSEVSLFSPTKVLTRLNGLHPSTSDLFRLIDYHRERSRYNWSHVFILNYY